MAGKGEVSEEILSQYKDVDKFLLYKWARVFSLFFDVNFSKSVDWSDFYLVARKARDIYGAESDQMRFARQSLTALWEGLRISADTNHDNVISLNEWIDLLRKTDAKKLPKWLDDYSAYMFQLFDVSGDDVIDVAEYADGMGSYGYNVEKAREAFRCIAVDGKGNKVDTFGLDQWKKYFNQYFFSTNKNDPGNHLFGKME